ncbi:MAG: hypothetical protein H0Z18_06175 [Thermococcus sp.]|uniref:hypothetical protein n=1 Tax=Thermococcus sp. TaxID=35749 RepID=UPI001E0371AC|nr:hypothetical protein [Thermococcus sp.]MBO8174828.1 hypothetical protein [Thermococcus sp.]
MNYKILNISIAVIFILLSKLSPYLTLLLPWYLGFLIISKNNTPEHIVRISVAPAIGLGFIIVLIHVLSWFNISLSFVYPIMVILTIGMSFLTPLGFQLKIKRKIILGLAIALILSLVVKIPFEEIPAYPGAVGVDAVYHAYKSLEMIKEDTVFISHTPLDFPDNIKNYPAGYHSIVVFISLTHDINVAQAMRILKLFTWIFLTLGTYSATKSLFKNDNIAVFSAIVMPLSYLYYYYLHYSLLHNFLNYYFFLVSVCLYNYSMEQKTPYNIFLTTLVVASMLIIHPYAYMFFQAYAGFTTTFYILKYRKFDKTILLFLIQALGSLLTYYVLEYPMRLPLSNYSKPIFNTLQYIFKDNTHWFGYILEQTFIGNGQFPLGLFFLVGVNYLIHRKNIYSLALLTVIIWDIFLIFNKIYFHIGIPFYSGIWSSERIYVLLTPLIPIVEGIGAYEIYSFLLSRTTKPKLVMMSFVLILIVPLFYVNVINFAYQKSVAVENEALETFGFLCKLPSENIFVPKFYDSGMWIGIFCPSKNIIPINNLTINNGLLYIDSRGYGDVEISPFNPWDFFGKYELIHFNDNIWIFNISKKSPRYPKTFREYYILTKDTIEASKFEDWKYLSYGFLLRHPAVIRGIILNKWNFVLSKTNESYIVFVPSEEYNAFRVKVFSTTNEDVEIKINGETIGYISTEGSDEFRYPFKPGNLYVMVFYGKSPYIFVEIELLKI